MGNADITTQQFTNKYLMGRCSFFFSDFRFSVSCSR